MHTEIFNKILPADRITTNKDDFLHYGKDVSKQFFANPSIVLFPTSIQEISSILKVCSELKLAVVPSGGRTGYSGGATAQNGEVILSLDKMNKILEVNRFDMTATVEAGVTTEALRNAAEEAGLYYPVDFTSKGSSHIGGNIATNAGGIRVIRYGNTRDWVLGLTVVLPNGEVIEANGRLFKNATGYDIRGLFVGSEGTLGIIARATMKLCRPPLESKVALCGIDQPLRALEVLSRLRSSMVVNVFEYFERSGLELVTKHTQLTDPFQSPYPAYLLIEVEAPTQKEIEVFEGILGEFLEDGSVSDAVFASSTKQTQDLMGLRERIGEVANSHYVPHKNDISVPVPSMPEFLAELQIIFSKNYSNFASIIFGHVGDGNLHVNVLKPEDLATDEFFKLCEDIDRDLFDLVKKYQGSISAEHGVGLLKKPFLEWSRSRREIDLMRSIKSGFDPDNIMNPGKIF